MNFEKALEFFKFLQGEDVVNIKHHGIELKLTPEQAFEVIYVLQEVYGLIPDAYELCYECLGLYNSEIEGDHFEDDVIGINLCDNCISNAFGWKVYDNSEEADKAVCMWWRKKQSIDSKGERIK